MRGVSEVGLRLDIYTMRMGARDDQSKLYERWKDWYKKVSGRWPSVGLEGTRLGGRYHEGLTAFAPKHNELSDSSSALLKGWERSHVGTTLSPDSSDELSGMHPHR